MPYMKENKTALIEIAKLKTQLNKLEEDLEFSDCIGNDDNTTWVLSEAIELCQILEKAFEKENVGYHTGLTGGCLYKRGERKDCDIIIYPHNTHIKERNKTDKSKITKIFTTLGIVLREDNGKMGKWEWQGKRVDFFILDECICGEYYGEKMVKIKKMPPLPLNKSTVKNTGYVSRREDIDHQ